MPIPIAAGIAAIGVAKKLFSHHRRPDISRAVAELRGSRPTGYLTPEDLAAAERTRGRLTEGVKTAGQQQGYEVARRFRARGLAGSPAEERARARLQDTTLLGAEHAGETAEEQLYNMRTGREAFQHQNDLAIFGAQVGDTQREQDRQDAQNGAFWNSLNEFVGPILTSLGSGTPTGGTFGVDGGDYGTTPPPRGFVPGGDTRNA